MSLPTPSELRANVSNMTKPEMIALRDELESTWNESYRPLMAILCMGCINKFKTPLSKV